MRFARNEMKQNAGADGVYMDEVCCKGALKVSYPLPYLNQLVYVARRKRCPKGGKRYTGIPLYCAPSGRSR